MDCNNSSTFLTHNRLNYNLFLKDSIDNLLKYTFKKFYNLDVSNLDIKQEDWTRTRKNKIRANNINTYSSVLPIAGSVPNDNQINVNTSNYNVMRQCKFLKE